MRRNSTTSVIRLLRRPYIYAVVFSISLTAAFTFTLLDTFVIPRAIQSIPQNNVQLTIPRQDNNAQLTIPMQENNAQLTIPIQENNAQLTIPIQENNAQLTIPIPEQPLVSAGGATITNQNESSEEADDIKESTPVITAVSYKDENIEISIETVRLYDTDIYIADVKVRNIEYLKAAFAQNTYGRNINEKTSAIAKEQNAIFAINGDYYGFRRSGWVLRNGILYRSGGSGVALLMDDEGNLSCDNDNASIEEQTISLWQIWSFGPPLVVDGAIFVTKNQEISGRSSSSNPRTAIGQVGELHYVFIVSDGRTDTSSGLSLYELASLFKERGCQIAYNLDGGGSSSMYFNGKIINKPTTNGKRISEREISDIVFIGY